MRRSPCAKLSTIVAILSCALALSVAAPVRAQSPAPPPVFPAVDSNGVDVATGAFNHSQTDVVIGQPGKGGLAYTRYYQSAPNAFWTHNHNGYITGYSPCSVVLGPMVKTFTSCTGTSNQGDGSTLTSDAYSYTYTDRDGTVAVFSKVSTTWIIGMGTPTAYLISVTKPDGEVTQYGYSFASVCYPDPYNCWVTYTFGRLSLVLNNFGNMLVFEFASTPDTGVPPNRITGINRTVEYCSGWNCSQSWPYATYTYNTYNTSGWYLASATNALGAATSYTYSGYKVTKVQFPDDANHSITIGYNASSRVSSINRGFGTWGYGYADASGQRTTTVTNPNSTARTYVSTISNGRINTVTNELSQTLSYQYDSNARETKVTLPEGNYTQYTYDSRGNITQMRQFENPGDARRHRHLCRVSQLLHKRADVQPADVDDRCPRVPNRLHPPDSPHGGVLTVTAPAPSGSSPVGSGTRPQTRFSYAQFQARYLQANNSTWTNGTAVWRLTGTSTCASSASCSGAAEETVSSTTYPGSARRTTCCRPPQRFGPVTAVSARRPR